MVFVTPAVFGRPPLLVYGVKRGKVPASLRPHVILKRQALGSTSCMDEMSRMMNCFKKANFQDQKCSKEISDFLDCAQISIQNRKETKLTQSGWTRDDLNAVLRENTLKIKKSRVRT